MRHRDGRYRTAAFIGIGALLVGMTTASFLPLIETDIW